ncbi:hypothetical protein ATANTOWER_029917 [Ataeniobius toweri]|uniref:Uncharacterized protein n=1 Tax=Ataeniobius toweri TaxID=208326 RepID=A0ABU7C4Q0_9TELE|nr:hypothetical protein [Ataeniobius toweri]
MSVSQAVSVEDCCRLQNYCWEAEWESLIERERTQALLRKGFLRRREHLWDWKEAGRMVAVWLPAEGAWQAVLLVAGLASLSSGSDVCTKAPYAEIASKLKTSCKIPD